MSMESLENLSLSGLIVRLLCGYNISKIEVDYSYRHEVATRVWITLNIHFGDKVIYISGSSIPIVKKRLLEWLDSVGGL